jgi:hypothetical protein
MKMSGRAVRLLPCVRSSVKLRASIGKVLDGPASGPSTADSAAIACTRAAVFGDNGKCRGFLSVSIALDRCQATHRGRS